MATKLLTQEELNAQNTALGRTQVNTAPANVGVSIKNEPITAASLESTTPITVPPAPTDTTDYSALLKGGQAAVDFYTNKQKEAQQSTTDINSLFKQYLGSSEAPPPVADLYSSEYEKLVAPQEEATVQAQSELDAINAELAGISAEAQAIPIRVEKDSIGRRSVSDAQGITRSQLRDLALRALPLQAQAIAAQAKLTGNTNLLRLAQDKLNTVFQLRSKDAENQYNYKKDLRDKVWDFLSASEKSRVESLQREDDRKFEMFKLATNNQNVLSRTALENGQGALAAQITALDPNSRTYTQDLAALQGQIKPDQLRALQIQKAGLDVQKAQQDLIPAGTEGGAGGISPVTGKPFTEVQTKSATFAERMKQAETTLFRGKQFRDIALFQPLKSAERRQFEQAAKNFVTAVLRKESGAAIAESEFEDAAKIYIPQFGDDQMTLEQKAQSRRIAFYGMVRDSAGAFTGEVAPATTATSGVTSSGIKYTITP